MTPTGAADQTSEPCQIGDVFSDRCPSHVFLGKLSNKWALLTIDALGDGAMRTNVLRNRLSGISQKVLTGVLRDLEGLGLVSRKQVQIFPPHVEYTLTDRGASLRRVVAQLDRWVERNYQ
ncbi:helix-turn-helix domain-containing protein (plasmid) [Aliisedimentitalea scapharcae]|uniref:Helix-turn-helix domain-containing protein n=1 Tax=Aliisedimentitalea scapharcae TaxID=1524259 RepID=A0ABZ2XYT1_9RHOB|nr:helix-turn-helix transcriptional regulator [Rhodobacteraceae bacterium M382]